MFTNISNKFQNPLKTGFLMFSKQCFIQYCWWVSPMLSNVPTSIKIGQISKYQKNNVNQRESCWCCFSVCQLRSNFARYLILSDQIQFCQSLVIFLPFHPSTFRKRSTPEFSYKRGNLISAKETFNSISFKGETLTLCGNKDVNSIGVDLKFRPLLQGELLIKERWGGWGASFSQWQIFVKIHKFRNLFRQNLIYFAHHAPHNYI